jgi:hypothetical protein
MSSEATMNRTDIAVDQPMMELIEIGLPLNSGSKMPARIRAAAHFWRDKRMAGDATTAPAISPIAPAQQYRLTGRGGCVVTSNVDL